MMDIKMFGAGLLAILSVSAVWAEERFAELAPGDSGFVYFDAKTPASGDSMDIKVDLPKGFTFEKAGYINRSFVSDRPHLVGQVSEDVAGVPKGWSRTNLRFSFLRRSQIAGEPNGEYELRLKVRHDLSCGEVSLLCRFGTDKDMVLNYVNIGTFTGKSDWQEQVLKFRMGEYAHGVRFTLMSKDGIRTEGSLEMASLELYHDGKKVELNSNDFTRGSGGWDIPGVARTGLRQEAVRFPFSGSGAQSYVYTEAGRMAPGTDFRTAPFFKVADDVKEGDYAIRITDGDRTETIRMSVVRRPPVRFKSLETALWLAESPFAGLPAAAKQELLASVARVGVNSLYIDGPTPANLPCDADFNQVKLPVALIDNLADRGFKVYAYCPFEETVDATLVDSYLKRHPEAVSKDWAGRPQKRICPTYLRREDPSYWQAFETVVRNLAKDTRLNGFFWDIEFMSPLPELANVEQNNHVDGRCACFCDRCRTAFREEYPLAPAASRTPFGYQMPYKQENLPEHVREILRFQPLEWIHFALERTNWEVARLHKAIKEVAPEKELRVYTGMYNRGNFRYRDGGLARWSEWCGVDWTAMKDHVDGIMGCHNGDLHPEDEGLLLREIGERKLPVILDISTNGLFGDPCKNFYSRILNIFSFCEAQGVALWGFWVFDACDYTELARAFRDLQKLERFFTEGRRADSLARIENAKNVKATVRILGDKRAVFLLNTGKETETATLRNLGLGPAANARWRAVTIDGESLATPAEITMEIPPEQIRIILLRDNYMRIGSAANAPSRTKYGETAAIQSRIDAAAAKGGGRVTIAKGVHPCGTLYLRSGVELHLEEGAVLRGGAKSEHYDDVEMCGGFAPEGSKKAFIVAKGATDVAITGKGVIDGQGPEFFDRTTVLWDYWWDKPPHPRPRMVQFERCRGVRFEGVTFKDCPNWTMWLRFCEDISVRDIRIVAEQKIVNSDGIDFDACRHVRVSDSFFHTGDDCLILRAIRGEDGKPVASEDTIVENCVLESVCQGVRIGCPSDDTVKDAVFRKIVFRGRNGIVAQNPSCYLRKGCHGYLKTANLLFEDWDCACYGNPVQILVEDGIALRDLGHMVFRNFTVKSKLPFKICGSDRTTVRDIRFENVKGAVEADCAFETKSVEGLVRDRVDVAVNVPVGNVGRD